MGPSKRTQLLSTADIRPRLVDRFIQDATKANLLKQVRCSLPDMASSFRCYADFCEMRRIPSFPAHEETVLQWSAMFNNTAAFGNYNSQLGKFCFFPRPPVTWRTAAVKHVVKGLEMFQDKSFRFPNFIRIRLLTRIIDHEHMGGEFAQAASLSFLFSFRVQSETICLVLAYSGDPLDTFPSQPEKAMMGVRTLAGKPLLYVNLARMGEYGGRLHLAPPMLLPPGRPEA